MLAVAASFFFHLSPFNGILWDHFWSSTSSTPNFKWPQPPWPFAAVPSVLPGAKSVTTASALVLRPGACRRPRARGWPWFAVGIGWNRVRHARNVATVQAKAPVLNQKLDPSQTSADDVFNIKLVATGVWKAMEKDRWVWKSQDYLVPCCSITTRHVRQVQLSHMISTASSHVFPEASVKQWNPDMDATCRFLFMLLFF